MDLIYTSLAIFFVWEFVLVALPWAIPAALQPVLVFGGALALGWPDWRLALASGGVVALLHVLVRDHVSGPPQMIRRPRRSGGIPPLP